MYVCRFACMYEHMHECMCVYVCVHVSMSACVGACVCMCGVCIDTICFNMYIHKKQVLVVKKCNNLTCQPV